jgi:hypothetical protein
LNIRKPIHSYKKRIDFEYTEYFLKVISMTEGKKKEKKMITVKIVNLIGGLLILAASIWILIDKTAAIDFFIVIIATALMILGFIRIFGGLYRDDLDKSVKVIKTITGIISLITGLLIVLIEFRFPPGSVAWLVLLASIALLLNGFSRFFTGIQAKSYPLWYRILIIIAGVFSFVIAILIGLTNLSLVMIFPNSNTQIILLAYTLMVLAISRISLIFLKRPEKIKEK